MMFFETPLSLIPETSPVRKIYEMKDEEPLKKDTLDDDIAISPDKIKASVEEVDEKEEEEKKVEENDSSSEKEEEENKVKENDSSSEKEEEENKVEENDSSSEKEEEENEEDDQPDEDEQPSEAEEAEKSAEESVEQPAESSKSIENKEDVICIDDENEDKSSVDDLTQKYSIKELRLMCKEKGLTQGGSKNDLASRILNDSKTVINIIS